MKFLYFLGNIYLHVIATGLSVGLAIGLHKNPNNFVAYCLVTGLSIGLGVSVFLRLIIVFHKFLNGDYD